MSSTPSSKEVIKIVNRNNSKGRKRKPRRLNAKKNRLVSRMRRENMNEAEKSKNKFRHQERVRRRGAILDSLSEEQKEALKVANEAAAQKKGQESVWIRSFPSVSNSGRRRRQKVLSGKMVRPDILEQEKLVRAWRAVRRGNDPDHPIMLESSEEDLEIEGGRVRESSCLSTEVASGAGSKYGVRKYKSLACAL